MMGGADSPVELPNKSVLVPQQQSRQRQAPLPIAKKQKPTLETMFKDAPITFEDIDKMSLN
jgi:hypothetical protein